jgi:hypothetical protein
LSGERAAASHAGVVFSFPVVNHGSTLRGIVEERFKCPGGRGI